MDKYKEHEISHDLRNITELTKAFVSKHPIADLSEYKTLEYIQCVIDNKSILPISATHLHILEIYGLNRFIIPVHITTVIVAKTILLNYVTIPNTVERVEIKDIISTYLLSQYIPHNIISLTYYADPDNYDLRNLHVFKDLEVLIIYGIETVPLRDLNEFQNLIYLSVTSNDFLFIAGELHKPITTLIANGKIIKISARIKCKNIFIHGEIHENTYVFFHNHLEIIECINYPFGEERDCKFICLDNHMSEIENLQYASVVNCEFTDKVKKKLKAHKLAFK